MSLNHSSPPDWLMPEGVDKTQWEYISNPFIAANYDASLKDNPSFTQDLAFLEKHTKKPGMILDLGCGTGRVADFFSAKQHKVIGIDISNSMLFEAANKKIKGHHLFLKANMLDLSGLSSNSIDYTSCLFSSFGMVLEEKHRNNMLKEVHRVLKPGGVFILHVHNLWSAISGYKGVSWLFCDLLSRLCSFKNFGNRLLPCHQGIIGLTLHLFTWNEIDTLLKKALFQIIEMSPLGNQCIPCTSPTMIQKINSHGYLIACKKS